MAAVRRGQPSAPAPPGPALVPQPAAARPSALSDGVPEGSGRGRGRGSGRKGGLSAAGQLPSPQTQDSGDLAGKERERDELGGRGRQSRCWNHSIRRCW